MDLDTTMASSRKIPLPLQHIDSPSPCGTLIGRDESPSPVGVKRVEKCFTQQECEVRLCDGGQPQTGIQEPEGK